MADSSVCWYVKWAWRVFAIENLDKWFARLSVGELQIEHLTKIIYTQWLLYM